MGHASVPRSLGRDPGLHSPFSIVEARSPASIVTVFPAAAGTAHQSASPLADGRSRYPSSKMNGAAHPADACGTKVKLAIDYLIRWDYISNMPQGLTLEANGGYRIRFEVLQTPPTLER